jgi:hypothetical protein
LGVTIESENLLKNSKKKLTIHKKLLNYIGFEKAEKDRIKENDHKRTSISKVSKLIAHGCFGKNDEKLIVKDDVNLFLTVTKTQNYVVILLICNFIFNKWTGPRSLCCSQASSLVLYSSLHSHRAGVDRLCSFC